MIQEDLRQEFEQALNEAWERYHCHGWLVDQFEDNYGECAFAKGFREGSRWMLDNPSGGALYHVLNKGCAQGYKHAVEKTIQWIKDVAEEWKGSGFKQVECEFATINDMIEDYKEYMEEQL